MLKLSNDRKVSPLSVWKASSKRWEPVVPNSLGLSAGLSCPGRTAFCDGCYAERTEKVFTSAGRLVAHNLELLRETDTAGMVALLVAAVTAFERTAEKRNVPAQDRVFRIHWDGDLFSMDYARAWGRTIRMFPNVQFWLYTRSFDYVDPFEGLSNVTVYLSVDAENVEAAKAAKASNPWVKLAFCADTWEATERLAEMFAGERKGPKCPELTGKLDMVGSDGKGACVTCGLCVFGKNNVRFAKEKKG